MPGRPRNGAPRSAARNAGARASQQLNARLDQILKPGIDPVLEWTEQQLDDAVEKFRRQYAPDVLSYHTHRSDRSERGYPDRAYCGLAGLVHVEQKREEGLATPHTEPQRRWYAALRQAPNGLVMLLHPSDYLDGYYCNLIMRLTRSRPLLPVYDGKGRLVL